jgi:alkylation response protein AidB-like acyl-CoA dehydrogenase
LKDKVARDVITGKKHIALAISEPYAGSDVANIRTTARREGDFFIVNGVKKWITGGLTSDYFTTVVRTGGEGMGGISLLLLEKGMPGNSTYQYAIINLSNV